MLLKTILTATAILALTGSVAMANCELDGPAVDFVNDIIDPATVSDYVSCTVDFSDVEKEFDKITREFTERLDNDRALAAAMGLNSYLQQNEDFSLAVGVGLADGAFAGALSGSARIGPHAAFQATLAVGEDEYAGRLAVRQGW